MSLSKEISKYQSILFNRKSNENQIDYVERKLREILRENDNFRVHILLGKLYLIKNNASLAKSHFLRAKQLNENAQSIYYGLFKINIIEKNYESAKNNLEKFISLNKNNTLNVELYKLLLDRLLGSETEYKIDDTYIYEKLNGQNLILYLTATKHILENEYETALESFEKLNISVKTEELPIDFEYVVKLVKELNKRKEFQKQELLMEEQRKASETQTLLINKKIELVKDYVWNNETQNIRKNIAEILEMTLNDKQVENILHEIPNLLDNNQYEIATYINECIKRKDIDNKYTRMTSFYEKLINEIYQIYTLNEEDKNNFENLLNKGREHFRNKEYNQALDFFTAGLYKTNIVLFNYYIGKTWFMIGKYREARRNLNLYNESGAYRIYKCKLFLSIINFKFGKKGKAYQMSDDVEYYANLMNRNLKGTLHKNTSDDRKLEKLFQMIDMKEEDFITDKCLTKEYQH